MADYYSNIDRGYRTVMSITTVGQDKVANTSRIKFVLKLTSSSSTSFAGYNCTGSITYDSGKSLTYSANTSLGFNSSVTLIDSTVTIQHDSNGTKSLSVSSTFSGSGGWSPGTLRIGAVSYGIADIKRASTVSAEDGTIGGTANITITRQDTSFTHDVYYSWNDITGTIATKTASTSLTWTMPMTFADKIPSATSSTGTITVVTYSGSTAIGTNTDTFTGTIPSSMVPTLGGITLTETDTAVKALLNSTTDFVQAKSNISVGFTGAAGSYSSTITRYYAEIVDKNQSTTSNNGTLGVMNYKGTVTINAYVYDSRGRMSATKTKTINVLPYAPPVLLFSLRRVGTLNNVINVMRSFAISPLTVGGVQKNKMTLSFKYAVANSSTYTNDTGSAGGTWTSNYSFTNAEASLGATFSPTSSYRIIGTLSDSLTTTPTLFEATISTENVLVSYTKNGVGVMKIREFKEFDVGGGINSKDGYFINNKPIQNYHLTEDNGASIELTTGTDLNNIHDAGFYRTHTAAATNLPPAYGGEHSWWYIRVEKHNAAYQVQWATDFNNVQTARRICNNKVWSPWVKMASIQDVSTTVSQYSIPSIGLPYGLQAVIIRRGNLVTLYVNRSLATVPAQEYTIASETIPSGYRPSSEAALSLLANSGSTNKGSCIIHIASSGSIKFTCTVSGSAIFNGTVTYITNDAYPTA